MADGDSKLKVELTLSEAAARHLKARADELGLSVDATVSDVVEQHLSSGSEQDWAEAYAALEEADRTGDWCSVDDALATFDAAAEKRSAARR